MLNFILASALTLGGSPQAPTQEPVSSPPAPELVEEAVQVLTRAFKHGKTPERLEALDEYGAVNDPAVVRLVTRGLSDKQAEVQLAAVECLRWLDHPDALVGLHKAYKKDKQIKKNDALYEAFIWAIGQHGSLSSIEILVEGAQASAPRAVQAARIYSLGHIPHKDSLEELLSSMQKTGRGRRRGKQPLMAEFALSLAVLSGQDFGKDEAAWTEWWRANKKGFEVVGAAETLSKRQAKQWQRLWISPKEKPGKTDQEKNKKRDEEEEERNNRKGSEPARTARLAMAPGKQRASQAK
ncbi:MAG: HEAT repeat domain-containing protein [bacterium]|nr:HEAT repeat domain-containing protein [Planctomycetota bacterium]HIL52470.1 HEAT repeat domain-containing protein [Planctomycetota bacterium]